MDIPKFLSLLESRALHFVRADKLGDPIEGTLPEVNARELLKARNELKSHKGGSRELHYQIRDFPLRFPVRFKWRAHINCWYGQDHETSNMWKAYGGTGNAVAITSTYDRLSNLIPEDYDIGAAKYIDYRTDRLEEHPAWQAFTHKRTFFRDEHEVRAIKINTLAAYDEGKAAVPPEVIPTRIDLKRLLTAVRVSPYADNWLLDLVKDVLRTYKLEAELASRSDISQQISYPDLLKD